MKYIVEINGEYILGHRAWPAYSWTEDKSKAMVFDGDEEFFRTHYPQFNLIEVKDEV